MCGLVGMMSSEFTLKHKDVLADLLYLDTWRGADSTGVAAIRANGDTAILKNTSPGYEFVEGPALGNLLRVTDICWIGHNRAGTVGKNTKSNAHPFSVRDSEDSCILVGAHNGTLTNRHELTDYKAYGTDSEALFNEIANSSIDDALAKTQGAWALTYFHHEDEAMNFIRNDKRPLYHAFTEDSKTIVWASEEWMIRVCCSRHGVKLFENKVLPFDINTLYTIREPVKRGDVLVMNRRDKVEGKESGVFTSTHPHGGCPPVRSGGEPKKALIGIPGPIKSNVTPLGSVHKGYNGILLSKNELEDHLAGGCAWCELSVIDIGDRFAWLDEYKPVCYHCLTDSHPQPQDQLKESVQ